MSADKTTRGAPKKQLCKHGHDTGLCGRHKNGTCKKCVYARNRIFRESPEGKEYSHVWYKTHKNEDRIKNSKWKCAGIKIGGKFFTAVDYDRAYQIQQGKCLGCHKHQSELSLTLCADHDHETGEFRALLCTLCNHILGQAHDNPNILKRLADYLEEKRINNENVHVG